MTNPLLADIPASVVEEMAPLLPLAWLVAGALVRARERLRNAALAAAATQNAGLSKAQPVRRKDADGATPSGSRDCSSPAGTATALRVTPSEAKGSRGSEGGTPKTTAWGASPAASPGPPSAAKELRSSDAHPSCLREEGECVERALNVPSGEGYPPADALRLQIRVPLPDREDLDVLCERMALQDEGWSHVGAWTQVTAYEYTNPLDTTRGQQACRTRTTIRPTLQGMSVTHEEPVGEGSVPLRARADPDLRLSFQRVTRRPWSRREDAANAVSDLWVKWRRPWSARTDSALLSETVAAGTLIAGDALAAAGFTSSEIWDNHARLLDETWDREESVPEFAADALLTVCYVRPVDSSVLPGIVGQTRVNHRMEKRLQSPLFSLTISCESEAPTFQEAERGLWRHAGLPAAIEPAVPCRARVRRWATLEPEDVPAWLRDTSVGPLAQALVLLRPLLTFRVLPPSRPLVPCGPGSGEAHTETLWHASFLARSCTTDDTLAAQLPQVCSVVEQLHHGKLCESIVDLFGEWGVFYSGALVPDGRSDTERDNNKVGCATNPKSYPTSGSMPRLFRPLRSEAFVARPKLFLADLDPEDRMWSWEVE